MIETVALAEAEALSRGPWNAFLSARECKVFKALRTEKRRLDWLAARLAAKRLIARLLGTDSPAPTAIEVVTRKSGRPALRLPRGLPPAALSLSHCEAGGLAAAAPAGLVGADWETVRTLDMRARELFMHPSESAAAPEAVIGLWTAKEAVLKLLGLGLGAGLRDVRFAAGTLSLHGEPLARWTRLGSPRIFIEQRAVGAAILAVARAGAGG